MIQNKVLTIAAAGKCTEVVLTNRSQRAAISDHVSPDLVYVGGVSEVDHVGGETAAGTHVNFQSDHIAVFTQTFMVFGQTEELEVYETALNAKALNGSTTGLTGILGQILYNVVNAVVVIVYDIHNGVGGYITGFEDGLAIIIDDGVIGVNLCGNELFRSPTGARELP